MAFESDLEATKKSYPFDRWENGFEHGLEQYTKENCNRARMIFDILIADLVSSGEHADESDKISFFETAVLSLNDLNDEFDGALIETGEREDLCELCNLICKAAGVDPEKYGDGEGPASEWRDW